MGQLGDGNYGGGGPWGTNSKSSPVSVLGGKVFSKVSAGNLFSAAIEASTGYVWTWGANELGQLGNGEVSGAYWYGTSSPISVLGGRSYSQIACGYSFVAAIEGSTGQAWAWGQKGRTNRR